MQRVILTVRLSLGPSCTKMLFASCNSCRTSGYGQFTTARGSRVNLPFDETRPNLGDDDENLENCTRADRRAPWPERSREYR